MTTHPLRVIGRHQETSDAASLWLEVPAHLRSAFAYRPGQFVVIRARFNDATIVRHYSLSSAPELDQHLRITVKKVPHGLVSSWLVDRVTAGDVLEITTPRGHFYERPQGLRHLVLLAAGSGIAPVMSIARHVLGRRAGHHVTVVFGNRSEEAIIHKAELDDLAHSYMTSCAVDYVLSRPTPEWRGDCGRIDQKYLEEHYDGWRASCALPLTFYLCGPAGFMTAAEAFLLGRPIPLEDIRHESFDLILKDDDREPDLIVRSGQGDQNRGPVLTMAAYVGGREVRVAPHADETILAALLRTGVDAPYSCQEGSCSSCLCRVRHGAVGVRPRVLKTLRPVDLDAGLTLACISRPATPTVSVDFDTL